MTNLDDFDRSLAAFLRDGPSAVPEAPVIAALAHARTTPRRRDPFALLRPDVMARRGFVLGLRPALVLAVVALLAAAVGIAVVGSRPQQSTPPTSSARPSGDASLPPTSQLFRASVDMLLTGGDPLVVTVADTTGDLREATSLMPQEGSSVATGLVRIDPDASDRAVFTVTWTGLPCEHAADLIVNEDTHRIEITTEACEGDAIGVDRRLRLAFAGPIDAELWSGSVSVIAPSGDPTAPPAGPSASPPAGATRVTLGTTDSREVVADVFDRSGRLSDVSVVDTDRAEAASFITATNVDARTIRLTWPGSTCDTVHRITIAADFGLTVLRPTCDGGLASIWSVRLTFDRAVDSDTLDRGLAEGQPSSDFPAFVVDGVDSAGGRWQLAIVDESGAIVNPARLDPTGVGDPGPAGVRLDQGGAAIVRLTWRDAPCATAPTLRVDRTGTIWRLESPGCEPAAPEVVRVLNLKLANPLSVDAITITLETPPPA